MFTGIVQAIGIQRSLEAGRLLVDVPQWPVDWEPVKCGESIAVNGCCLTVTQADLPLAFDLSPETLSRTAFAPGPSQKVNLERAMKLGDRLGGHIVQGHVDGLSQVLFLELLPDDFAVLKVEVPEEGASYLIEKGSITLSGTSLTVVRPRGRQFEVHLIPQTLQETNLGDLRAGDWLNTEYDVLAKHVQTLLQPRLGS